MMWLKWRNSDRVPGCSGFPCYTRILALAALALILLVILMGAARAEGKIMYVCTQTDPLNVREEPNLHSSWAFQLDRGEEVTVHEIRHGWAYVEWTGQYGWAWAAYLGEKKPVNWLAVEDDPPYIP